MQALTKVKDEIEFNKRFHALVDVLKSIAAAEFHSLEEKLKVFGFFDEALDGFFDLVDTKTLRHPFVTSGNRPTLMVAVTSDQGLLGGLNLRVVASAMGLMESAEDELIIIGEQGKSFARGGRRSFVSFGGIRDDKREVQARQLRNYLMKRVIADRFGYIKVVYPRALSLTHQQVEVATLLPLAKKDAKGPKEFGLKDMIFESSWESIVEYLGFLLIGRRLGDIFGMSRLAEVAARYMHLEESGQKLDEIAHKLKLQYFRLRHELIDASMRELFSARMVSGNE